jgi:hypothetical protein
LLVKRDEFSVWIGGEEKYSSGSRSAWADRGFWLQTCDGGPYTGRIGRGETHVSNLSVSLLGGIQPAKLIESRGLTSDGLLQRGWRAGLPTAQRYRPPQRGLLLRVLDSAALLDPTLAKITRQCMILAVLAERTDDI